MTRPLLPPKGVFIGSRVLFDARLPAPVKETLLQLMALAWQSRSHTTIPLSYALLTHLTGKSARTLRGHFLMLRSYRAVLRLQSAGTGQFIIVLADGLFDNRIAFESGKTLPEPDHDQVKEDEEEFNLPSEDDLKDLPPLPDNLNDQSDPPVVKTPPAVKDSPAVKDPPAGRPPKVLKKNFLHRMEIAGVFPYLFDEVAQRAADGGYTQNDLEALLDWCLASESERPGGLFIFRLRKGLHAPGKLADPPCPRCGLRGKHAPDCPHRYALDNL